MHWFRFYNEALDDPKVQRLDGDTFKTWVNLLCLCARHDGLPKSIQDISFALRVDVHGCSTVLSRLADAGLLDRLHGGVDGMHYAIHAWDKRQYKSDTSTERVKRFRERSSNATETVNETPPETDTDTETDKIQRRKKVITLATRLPEDWQPSDGDIDFAISLDVDYRREADIFRDYWIAQAGAKGRKANWQSTWRNWIRRASERIATQPNRKETAIEMGKRLIRENGYEPHSGNTIDHDHVVSLPRQQSGS